MTPTLSSSLSAFVPALLPAEFSERHGGLRPVVDISDFLVDRIVHPRINLHVQLETGGVLKIQRRECTLIGKGISIPVARAEIGAIGIYRSVSGFFGGICFLRIRERTTQAQ